MRGAAAGRETRNPRNDPMHGEAGGEQTRNPRNDPMRGAAAGEQTRNPRNDPMHGVAAGEQTRNRRNDPMRGAAVGEQTRNPRNDPKRGAAAGARGALAREVVARRLRAELALRGNDPMRGPVGAGPGTKQSGGGARVAPQVPPLGSTWALALGSTQLARTWEPSVAEILTGHRRDPCRLYLALPGANAAATQYADRGGGLSARGGSSAGAGYGTSLGGTTLACYVLRVDQAARGAVTRPRIDNPFRPAQVFGGRACRRSMG
jgi:hypothetical protein